MSDTVIAPDLRGRYTDLQERLRASLRGDVVSVHNDEITQIPQREMALIERVSRAEQENVALNAQIGGFPNVNALREAMIATADENVSLRAKAYRDMCADGHMQIGFSGEEFGLCPLCALRAKLAKLENTISTARCETNWDS